MMIVTMPVEVDAIAKMKHGDTLMLNTNIFELQVVPYGTQTEVVDTDRVYFVRIDDGWRERTAAMGICMPDDYKYYAQCVQHLRMQSSTGHVYPMHELPASGTRQEFIEAFKADRIVCG